MSFRTGQVRFQEATTDNAPLFCGVPERSPISPILFLLYTQPIYQLGISKQRFGYADDIAMLQFGNRVEDTAKEATEDISALVAWGQDNALHSDPIKTEVMHFSRQNLQSLPVIQYSGVLKFPEESLRRLGIYFDQRLSFKIHVNK